MDKKETNNPHLTKVESKLDLFFAENSQNDIDQFLEKNNLKMNHKGETKPRKNHIKALKKSFLMSIDPKASNAKTFNRKSYKKITKDTAFDADKQIKKFIKKK